MSGEGQVAHAGLLQLGAGPARKGQVTQHDLGSISGLKNQVEFQAFSSTRLFDQVGIKARSNSLLLMSVLSSGSFLNHLFCIGAVGRICEDAKISHGFFPSLSQQSHAGHGSLKAPSTQSWPAK